MKISANGILEIAEHEGIVLGPYKDSVGVWTYGVGHTAAAGGLDPAKMKREDTRGWSAVRVEAELIKALRLFDEDLDKYEARVARAVKVPLKPHEFDALVSFDFNTGGIYKAKLTEAINRGDKGGDGFMGWVKPKEIIKRRKAEQALFRTGAYDANGDDIPVYDALGDGRLRHRMTISGAKLRGLMPMRERVGPSTSRDMEPVNREPTTLPLGIGALVAGGILAAWQWGADVVAWISNLF